MARRATGWRAEAQALSEAVPYARAQRIRRRLRERALARPGRLRWHWSLMIAFGAGAAVVLLMVAPMFGGTERSRTDEVVASVEPRASDAVAVDQAPGPDLALAVSGNECERGAGALEGAAGLRLGQRCVITGVGVDLRSEGELWIRGDAQEIELRRGRLEVHVDPRVVRARPFVIDTAALRIEVTGTRFAVSHAEAGGELELWEGSVRVVTPQGAERRVAAGQRLRWTAAGAQWRLDPSDAGAPEPTSEAAPEGEHDARPREPATRRKATASAPEPAATDTTVAPADRLVHELERLRERGQTAEAVELLERGLPDLARRDREILSFELGQLLERTRGTKAACVHWAAYQRAFGGGRYADLVEAERARLECDPG